MACIEIGLQVAGGHLEMPVTSLCSSEASLFNVVLLELWAE